jgi:Plexin cytoplasmic RasGAP domain
LLFAKDIPLYRQLVLEFYADIQQLPQVSFRPFLQRMRPSIIFSIFTSLYRLALNFYADSDAVFVGQF